MEVVNKNKVHLLLSLLAGINWQVGLVTNSEKCQGHKKKNTLLFRLVFTPKLCHKYISWKTGKSQWFFIFLLSFCLSVQFDCLKILIVFGACFICKYIILINVDIDQVQFFLLNTSQHFQIYSNT